MIPNLKTLQESARAELEELSERIHHIYCAQYEKDNGKPYWTNGDYSKLDERTKEYDRNIARWHLSELDSLTLQTWNAAIESALEALPAKDSPSITTVPGNSWNDGYIAGWNSHTEEARAKLSPLKVQEV